MLRAVAEIPLYVGSFTYANLPDATTNNGRMAFASDLGANGTHVVSNGTRWRPINGRAVLKLAAASSAVNNTETIVCQAIIPAGAWQAGDLIATTFAATKSGTTDAGNQQIRIGTAGTTGDTAMLTAQSQLVAAANVNADAWHEFQLVTNTTAQRTGAQAGGGLFSIGTANATQAAATISSAASNALYVSITLASAGTTNTLTLQTGRIELITP